MDLFLRSQALAQKIEQIRDVSQWKCVLSSHVCLCRNDFIPRVPSGEATNPLKKQLPSSSLAAYPAIGVRHEPSSVSRNALSHATASLVSSWFNEAK